MGSVGMIDQVLARRSSLARVAFSAKKTYMINLKSVDKTLRYELAAIARTLCFLFVGFSALLFAKNHLKVTQEILWMAFLLMPFVFYVILSGKIQELKAPGGIEAKFSTVANKSISAASETVKPESEELQSILKGSTMQLEQRMQEFDDSKPIIMLLQLGTNGYAVTAAKAYIEELSQFRNFKFVVFLDHRKRFVGYMSAWSVKCILQKEALSDDFINAVNRGLTAELMRYPGFETQTITTTWTNVRALQEMVRKNVEALIVINDRSQIEGVIEREQIICLMMLSLVNGA